MAARRPIAEIIATCGSDLHVARLLGVGKETVQHWRGGRSTPSDEQAAWLEGYARIRSRQREAEAAWLERNPPPPSQARGRPPSRG